jgi:hypothetical protein
MGHQGRDTDVGGHAQARSQGGTCDGYNLFPQDKNFNNSAYKVSMKISSKRLWTTRRRQLAQPQ